MRRASSDSGRDLQSWALARVRLLPGLLVQSSPWVRSKFDHAWAPMQAFIRQARRLPPSLWSCLLCCNGGFVAITAAESRYATGVVILRHRPVQNVAFVSVRDLAEENERPLHVIGHLIDHYLGCGGEEEGPWLSQGGGLTTRWREAGARLPALFALGYAVDDVAGSGIRDYFAQSLAYYCLDRQRLNVADPQIEKWFRTNLWDRAFWLEIDWPAVVAYLEGEEESP